MKRMIKINILVFMLAGMGVIYFLGQDTGEKTRAVVTTISVDTNPKAHITETGATGWVIIKDDTTNPVIDNPSDFTITYNESKIDYSITWTATDENPDTYLIYQNSLEIDSGFWISTEPIIISLDGLSVGSYNYTIVVTDELGNSATDTVIVIITTTENPNNPNETLCDNPDNEILNNGGVYLFVLICFAAVVIMLNILKRRS